MFERVNETVRYAKAPTAIGVVTHGTDALLIDTGLDENLVRKVLNALANEGVTPRAIINTHSHADHCGGNAFVQKRCVGCRTYAPAYEHYFVERPDLEPYTLFGAPAPDAMRGKFLQAQPSRVDVAVDASGERVVEGFRVRFRALAGHSVNQMGVEVDGALFVGDALLPPAVADKYGLLFCVDPAAARASAEGLRDHRPSQVVAYHGGLIDDVEGAVEAHVERTATVEGVLLEALAKGPASEDDLLAAVLDRFPPAQASVELNALQAATLRSYLSSMERSGRVAVALEGHRRSWQLR